MSTSQKSPEPQASPRDFLTVDEAARVVRIGRTTAYDIAQVFEATDGAEGLPVIRLGKQLESGRMSRRDRGGHQCRSGRHR